MAAVMSPDVLLLRFPDCLREDFATELPIAEAAVARVVDGIADGGFENLARTSPALAGNDWPKYLRCSLTRMVHAQQTLAAVGVRAGRVLDYGSYFGNFSLQFAAAGFRVDALDAYSRYAPAFDRQVAVLRSAGVRILDFEETEPLLTNLIGDTYDVVLAMGVIEHLPHTPRPWLEAVNRVLKPGGVLVMDTPNQAYLYNRQRLARGESIMTAIAAQYASPIPFEGHHREYTAAELVWMLDQLGHEILGIEYFNYSIYGLVQLEGRQLQNFWAMATDPTLREVILTVSRKPRIGARRQDHVDWRSLVRERETWWRPLVPAHHPSLPFVPEQLEHLPTVDLEVERLVAAIARSEALLNERPLDRLKRIIKRRVLRQP
jgi:2-polyprenyl-3-methyl-5-hydroxy-6-metoxy-1,4-benzoquinol methylase